MIAAEGGNRKRGRGMAALQRLRDEMETLQKQIETVLSISEYRENEDLSGLSDYAQVKSADEWQRIEMYQQILGRLEKIQDSLSYYKRPVQEVSRISRNEDGRFETERGHYFTSGNAIEFLRTEQIFNYGTGEYEDADIWTKSRIEHNGMDYYIVGYPDVPLPGLQVRVRGEERWRSISRKSR